MAVTIACNGEIAVVSVDNPPVNALSRAVRQGLADAVRALDSDPDVSGVVLACAGKTFIAGADVKEFGLPPMEPHLPDVIAAIEGATKPWLAAIHGTALGGGFEVTLGCAWRIIAAKAKVGLPEVTLGIIPGAGGTVRLPRLIGVEAALDLATSGKPVGAARALDLGAVDAIAEGDLLSFATTFLRTQLGAERPVPLSRRPCDSPDAAFWDGQEKALSKKARGQHSPLAVLDSVRAACEKPFPDAMAFERKTFLDLRQSDQAAALRHAFFAERAVSKVKAIDGMTPRPVSNVAVIGGGTMGAGITASLRNAGLPVVLVERDEDALEKGLANLGKIYDSSVKKKILSDADARARRDGVTGTTDYAALAEVDLVIEAVFEDLEVKRDVFRRLDAATRPDAILATNTSYLDPNAIAETLSDRSRFIGLHFFSPAHIMKLLEIVRAAETAPDVLAAAFDLGKKLRKVGVMAGVCDGFIGNRILKVYRRQADYLLADGCLPADIDAAMRGFGLPMGPYEAQDLGGLDIAWANRKAKADSRDPNERYVRIADRLCERGRFGQKTGKGWYAYEPGNRKPQPDPEVEAVILELSRAEGITRRTFEAEEIRHRILYPMINEGARILEEGIAERPLDIDLVEIHGYGFPRWRGGLMHTADAVGVGEIRDALAAWAEEDATAYSPCDLLNRLADSGEGFDGLNA